MNEEFEGSISKQKLAQVTHAKPGVGIFFTPKGEHPVCNSVCKGCYFFANYSPGESAIPAVSVPEFVSKFQEKGYGSVYLISSEVLLAPNYKDILKAAGNKYVNTNGRVIASQGDKILEQLVEIGVKQIVITANVTSSHQTLNLTPPGIIETAFQNVKDYNTANPDKSFTALATTILTAENYDKVPEICDYVHDVYGTKGIKFIAYIPLSGDIHTGIPELAPSLDQIGVAVSQIKNMRGEYDQNEFYIERGGSLGTQELTPEKVKKLCPAGEALHVVKSLAEEAPVTSCIYIPQFPIGHIENGKVVVDEERLETFRAFKSKVLEAGYCPAHAINTRLSYFV